MDNSKVIELLKNESVDVVFTKVNGEERIMRCTLQEAHLPPITVTDASKAKKPNDTALTVFDMHLKAWRSFRWANLISVNDEPYVNG